MTIKLIENVSISLNNYYLESLIAGLSGTVCMLSQNKKPPVAPGSGNEGFSNFNSGRSQEDSSSDIPGGDFKSVF